jgi:hypothetical protein
VTSSTFKPGDEVLLRIKSEGTDAESFCAATVLDVDDPRGIHIWFAVPNSDGDLEDWVAPADLKLSERPAQSPYSYSKDEVVRIVANHISGLFQPEDLLCFTFIHRTKKTSNGQSVTENVFVPFTEAITAASTARLQARNDEDWNVYVACNPVIAKSRRKDVAGSPRTVFMECDEDGESVLAQVRASVGAGEIPPPTVIMRSSPAKYQFIWRIVSTDFTMEEVEAVNEALVSKFGADPASTDRLRVFRVPGLRNLKYPQRPVVTLIELNPEGRYGISDFKIAVAEAKTSARKPVAAEDELSAIVSYFEEAATQADLRFSPIKKWGNNGYLWELTCPFVNEHTGQKDSGTVVILHKSGALDFVCQHGHCKERTWPKDFRPKLEELVGHSLRFGDPVGGTTLNNKIQTVSMDIYRKPENTSSSSSVSAPAPDAKSVLTSVSVSEIEQLLPPKTGEPKSIPPFDPSIITGFYSDVVELVTRDNTLPPQFVYGVAKTLVGARCAGITKFKTTTAEARYYLALLGETGSGKGESWRRTMAALRSSLSGDIGIKLYDSADSGAGLKESFFADPLGQPVLVYVDEVADLGYKSQANKNPEILTTMVTLAEGTSITRLLAQERRSRDDARLAVVMCGQPDIYPSSFTGIKGGLLGWYDRLTPEFAEKPDRITDLAPLDRVEAYKLYESFNSLPFLTEIGMSTPAQRMIDDYWNGLLPEERIVRRRKNILIDCYMGAFGRRAREVEVSDVSVAIRLFERQQIIRYLHFDEQIPDRVGFYQSKIKKIMEQMADELARGLPPNMVRKTRRYFERCTHSYRDNEGHYFAKAWAVFAPVYLNQVTENNKTGTKVEYFLPKWRN